MSPTARPTSDSRCGISLSEIRHQPSASDRINFHICSRARASRTTVTSSGRLLTYNSERAVARSSRPHSGSNWRRDAEEPLHLRHRARVSGSLQASAETLPVRSTAVGTAAGFPRAAAPRGIGVDCGQDAQEGRTPASTRRLPAPTDPGHCARPFETGMQGRRVLAMRRTHRTEAPNKSSRAPATGAPR